MQTLNAATHLGELLGDFPICTWTGNQLGAQALPQPTLDTNKRAQRQFSGPGVRTSQLQPNRGPSAARKAPTSDTRDSSARTPANHQSLAEFYPAERTLGVGDIKGSLEPDHDGSRTCDDGMDVSGAELGRVPGLRSTDAHRSVRRPGGHDQKWCALTLQKWFDRIRLFFESVELQNLLNDVGTLEHHSTTQYTSEPISGSNCLSYDV